MTGQPRASFTDSSVDRPNPYVSRVTVVDAFILSHFQWLLDRRAMVSQVVAAIAVLVMILGLTRLKIG